jgi:hypothetical protein
VPERLAELENRLENRLLELEDRLALVEAGLAQLDRKVGTRLDEQMARIVMAVAELLNQRAARPAEPRPKRQAWPKIDW